MIKYLTGVAAVLATVTATLAFVTGDISLGALFVLVAIVNTIDTVAEHLKGERLVKAADVLREYLTNESKN